MRFCLACRQFSATGPLCSQCGRSFGGRLCKSKKRHLNPPDAQFCTHCGNTELADATIGLGCSLRGLLVIGICALLWCFGRAISASNSPLFWQLTGYRSPGVWLIEKSANALIVLFVFYFLSLFLPGEAGRHFRNTLSSLSLLLLKFSCKVLWHSLLLGGNLLGRLWRQMLAVETMESDKKK